MNRAEFLSTCWLRYPQAETGWSDVETFQRGHGSVVCGRLSVPASDSGLWLLSSNGVSIEFTFSSETRWLRSQNDAEFSASYLKTGDLCALVLKSVDGILRAENCLLLAPSVKDWSIASEFSVKRSRDWAAFLQAIRTFFEQRAFIEAATPTLVPSPGTEPYLDAFESDWSFGSRMTKFYLPTSPEFHLKKMLAKGWTRIFEMKPCFRNGELSETHQAEFLMLEWYRAYATLDAIADDVAALIEFLSTRQVEESRRAPFQLVRTTMAELFAKTFDGFRLTSETTIGELRQLALKFEVHFDESDSWDEVFFRIFIEKIESGLGHEAPILVRGYPPSQAALSRIAHNGFADRFEVYWKGFELANAFHELNDPDENRARFVKDNELKVAIGKKPVPLDTELLSAFAAGVPPAGGIALGVERLFMAIYGIRDIAETRAFPLRP